MGGIAAKCAGQDQREQYVGDHRAGDLAGVVREADGPAQMGSVLSGPGEEVGQHRCQNVVGYPVPLTGQAAVGAVG